MSSQTAPRDRVISIVSRVLGVPASSISEDSSPDTIGHWDSLAHMRLMLALEEEFGLRFTDEEIMSMTRVATMVSRIDGRLR